MFSIHFFQVFEYFAQLWGSHVKGVTLEDLVTVEKHGACAWLPPYGWSWEYVHDYRDQEWLVGTGHGRIFTSV